VKQCYCVPLQYTIVLCVPSDVTLYRCYWYCVTAGTKRARDIQSGQRCSSLQFSWLYAVGRSRTEEAADCHTGGTTDALSCYSPTNFPVQMTRDHSSQMTKLSFQLRRCSSCLTPLPLALPLFCQGTVTTPFLLNIVSPEVNLLRCLRKTGQIAAATVTKGRVRRLWSRVISTERADLCCTTRQPSLIEYLQTVTGPLTVSLTFGSPADS